MAEISPEIAMIREVTHDDISQLTKTIKNRVSSFSPSTYELPYPKSDEVITTPQTRREVLDQRSGRQLVTMSYDRTSSTDQIRILVINEQQAHQQESPYEEIIFDLDEGVYKYTFSQGIAERLKNGLTELHENPETDEESIEGYLRMEKIVEQVEAQQNPKTNPRVVKALQTLVRPLRNKPKRVSARQATA